MVSLNISKKWLYELRLMMRYETKKLGGNNQKTLSSFAR